MERADQRAEVQVLLLSEGWNGAGWTNQEAICSPDDPPHLEVTQSLIRLIYRLTMTMTFFPLTYLVLSVVY